MTDRARLGLVACLITFFAIVCPGLLVLRASIQGRSQAAGSQPSAKASVALTGRPASTFQGSLNAEAKAAIDYADSLRRKAEEEAIDANNNRRFHGLPERR